MPERNQYMSVLSAAEAVNDGFAHVYATFARS